MPSPSASGSGSNLPPSRPGRPGVGSGDPSAPSTGTPITVDAPTNVSSLTGAVPPASRVDAATNAAGRGTSSSAIRQPSVTGVSSRPTVSMVPGRGTGAAALRGQPRMTFKPVMPQRRKPSGAAPSEDLSIKQEGSSGSTDRGRGAGGSRRGARGGPGGTRGARRDIQLVASGPFSLGTGSTSKADRARQSGANRSGRGGGAGGGISAAAGKWGTAGEGNLDESEKLKPDPGRMAYRNPDKLREKEEYSDQDEDVEIVDLDDVGALDELAPRALPRVQEKNKRRKEQQRGSAEDKEGRTGKGKGKGKVKTEEGAMDVDVKPDPDDEEQRERSALAGSSSTAATISSGTSTPLHEPNDTDSASDTDELDGHRGIDALDLSESEAEELGDDLVDDFVFDEEDEDSNRLYLFQFPQLFPKFKLPKARNPVAPTAPGAVKATGVTTSALSSSPPGGSKPKRSVAFAEGTLGGDSSTHVSATSTATASPSGDNGSSAANGVKREDPSASISTDSKGNVKPEDGEADLGPEGMIGRLQVYKDGRVEMHFGKIVMEVSGGSQTTFLQDLALLDTATRRATILGEVHRKFTVSPNVENMLDDMAQEQARVDRVKKEGGGSEVKADGGSGSDDSGDEV